MKETAQKILSIEDAKQRVLEWKREGKRIVFTNGCFDIVHLGHIDYLEKASALGDKLVLGLNTDASVCALNGAARPDVDVTARARMIAAMVVVVVVCLYR